MPAFGILAAFFFLYVALLGERIDRSVVRHDRAEAVIYAGHLRAYVKWTANYARSTPAATGTIADTALGVPAWYRRFPGVTNTVAGGVGYVYFVPDGMARGFAIARAVRGDAALQAGIKVAGRLTVPGATGTGVTLPATIPEGAVVLRL